MILQADPIRGKKLADLLYHKFLNEGIHGITNMPEDEPPDGVTPGSFEHRCFISFTVAIDYMRDAPTLWNNSRLTFSDPETNYLFFPKKIELTGFEKVVKDMQKHGLSQRPERDANIWHTLGITFSSKWGGDPINFIEGCNWDAIKILEHLIKDRHFANETLITDFPNLRGPKIGPLWIRMLRDNVGISKLINLDKVPIPIDIHIARATITTGVLKGQYRGNLGKLFPEIRSAWAESIKELSIKSRPMIVLDIDEPLWTLSKYGCSGNRNKISGTCLTSGRCAALMFSALKYDFNSLVKLLFLIAHFVPDSYAHFTSESGAQFVRIFQSHFVTCELLIVPSSLQPGQYQCISIWFGVKAVWTRPFL